MPNLRIGRMDLGLEEQTPQTRLALAAENEELRKRLKEREKEVERLREENEFLKETSAFSQRAIGSREKRKNEIYRKTDRRWL